MEGDGGSRGINMVFIPKDWKNSPDTLTPLNADALKDLETRLSGYTDTQVSSSASGKDFYAEDYGAKGDGVTDDTGAIQATLNAMGTGNTLRFKRDRTYKYTAQLSVPTHARLRGFGRSTILNGPGIKCLAAVNTYVDADLYINDLYFDGSGYIASGRGIDLLGASMATIERVKFIGFQDQIVADYCQRVQLIDTEHVASSGTRTGLWVPYGPDAHAGVNPTTGTTNIVKITNSHFNWNNSPTGIPIASDGGLQHVYDNVQCSYGTNSIRLGQPSGVVLRSCDLEFMSGATVLTANTSLIGTALPSKTAALTIGPANYFSGQVDLANTDVLVDLGNDFHIPSLPVYKNCTSATSIFSIGSGNVSAGGTMFDANPASNLFTYNRTGIATFRNTVLGFGFRANGGGALSNPQMWVSSLPTSVNFGTNYGFGVDQNGVAIAWGVAHKGRSYTTVGRPSAATVGAGGTYFDTTLNKPVWSDGTNWRDAAGTIV